MASCQKLDANKFDKFIRDKITYVDKKEQVWSVKTDTNGKIKPYQILDDNAKTAEKGYYFETSKSNFVKIKNPKTFAKQFCDNYE